MKYYVGIDLGGTNTKIGLVDEKGNIIFKTIVKTDFQKQFKDCQKFCLLKLKEATSALMMFYQLV